MRFSANFYRIFYRSSADRFAAPSSEGAPALAVDRRDRLDGAHPGHGERAETYAGRMADGAEAALQLDVAAMTLEMGPPTADDVPIALDGTLLDSPGKVMSYLEQINAARDAEARQRAS